MKTVAVPIVVAIVIVIVIVVAINIGLVIVIVVVTIIASSISFVFLFSKTRRALPFCHLGQMSGEIQALTPTSLGNADFTAMSNRYGWIPCAIGGWRHLP